MLDASLDVADLVVIAGQVLGIRTAAALEQADTQAAETALAEAPAPSAFPDSYAAAVACARLMRGLLRYPPFPEHRERVAVAAGLQFLAVKRNPLTGKETFTHPRPRAADGRPFLLRLPESADGGNP